MTDGIIQKVFGKEIDKRIGINRAWSENEITLMKKLQQELIEEIKKENTFTLNNFECNHSYHRMIRKLIGDNE